MYTDQFCLKKTKTYIVVVAVTKTCPTLCDLMDRSTPGSPVPHYLPEFAQIHVY